MTFTKIPRILCVDDDFDSLELIRFMLSREKENYKVMTAASIDEAKRLISKESFDLYILDYCLPLTSGIQLCRQIRENDKTTPVLFYSAMGRQVDREIALKAGANEYLTKPNDFEELPKTVFNLLNNDK
jgi:two-component system phosphate regulon response regulator PhoB